MTYQGPERRRHRVYVTSHTEYHMRDARVVAVRDIETGQWRSEHECLGSELVATLCRADDGGVSVRLGTEADVGVRLCFDVDLLTSPLLAIRRPPLEIVKQYAA